MAYAEIHEYTNDNVTALDDEGELLRGFYFRIVDDEGHLKMMMGPYNSAKEAEIASTTAWDKGDF